MEEGPASPVGGRAAPPVPDSIPDHGLLHAIGRGAYGEVWLARSALGTLRAVKVVRRGDFADARPFDREFHGIRKFEPISRSHPGLIDILQVGCHPGGEFFYYVMELADPVVTEGGGTAGSPGVGPEVREEDYRPRTLRTDLLDRGRLPGSECLRIVRELAGALECLHAAGLVHRDLKPSNIVFVRGRPKLADIGLVTDAGDGGSVVGTDGYLPPEGAGTAQADLYGLGKVLYEMVTGLDRRRFPELPAEEAEPAERETARELNAVILRACAPEPSARYASATELRRDLERIGRGRSVRRRLAWRTLGRRIRPSAWILAAGLAVVAWWLGVSREPTASAPDGVSVFVLPFRVAGNSDPASFGSVPGRMTDAFIDALASLPGVRRSPRRSAWVRLDEEEVLRGVAATNDFNHILTGRVGESHGHLEVELRLLPGRGGKPVWEAVERGSAREVPALVRALLVRLTGVLGLAPEREGWEGIGRILQASEESRRLVDEGYALYERDCMVFASYRRIIALSDEARRIDPRHLDARFLRAMVQRDLALLSRPPSEIWPDMLREAEMILAEDPTHTAALNFMCAPTWYRDWNWDGQDAWVQRQLRLEVGHVREFLRAIWLRSHGEFAAAAVAQRESESVPILDQARGFHALGGRWTTREYDDGIRLAREILGRLPDRIWPHYWLAHLQIARGDFAEGLEAIDRIDRVNPIQNLTALRGYAYARMGLPDRARAVLLELEDQSRTQPYLQPYFPARILAALGETEAALDHLEEAERDRSEFLVFTDLPGGLRTDPAWDGLQEHPRFQALLRKVGLGVWPVPIRPLPD